MGFKTVLLSLILIAYCFQYGDGRMSLTIKDFLSNSSNVDHSQALQSAWKALCAGKGESLVIQASERYTILPQLFQGPCVSPNPRIQIDGTIEAPKIKKDWGVKGECWLRFEKVTGLVLTGTGLLDAHGESWWSSVADSSRPGAVRFNGCKNILYSGLTQKNSPRNHISIVGCTNSTFSNLYIIAPENSPNTDGIDIVGSQNINVLNSSIQTGDDCIAINGGSSTINITSVACGPGHGISIGSLGKGGANEMVQDVNVRHCSFIGTQNAARIKTWPGGQGFAKNILYENITLTNARFPIIIHQHYCNGGKCPSLRGATAVKVSDITFRNFRGTCGGGDAIKLDCDENVGCDNILMEQINITSSSPKTPLTTFCNFAHIITRFVSVSIKCATSQEPPAPQPQAPAPDAQPSSSPIAQPPAPIAQPPSLFFPFYYMF